ncbi:MAG: hypothetical protein HY038_14315 [Nitrospirae bacterium]|nr:hypothetical protein [Nitrospirota bacterium]
MFELLFAGALVLLIWALSLKHSIFKTLARIFTALVALASATAMVLLFMVGQKAHWTSDGPGMLLVMVGILFCGMFTFVFGGLFFTSFNRSA